MGVNIYLPLKSVPTVVKSMYGKLLQQISIPPAAELSNPTYTPATDGWVGFVDDPVHEMAPHVIALVVRVELFNVRDAEAFPLTCILKSLFVTL